MPLSFEEVPVTYMGIDLSARDALTLLHTVLDEDGQPSEHPLESCTPECATTDTLGPCGVISGEYPDQSDEEFYPSPYGDESPECADPDCDCHGTRAVDPTPSLDGEPVMATAAETYSREEMAAWLERWTADQQQQRLRRRAEQSPTIRSIRDAVQNIVRNEQQAGLHPSMELRPRCDFCGDPEYRDEGWNAETGNHTECEIDRAQATRDVCTSLTCACNAAPYVPTPADALPATLIPEPVGPEHTHGLLGTAHPHDCPACVFDALARETWREANNPHRRGTAVAARWFRDRARVDHAMDMRTEAYWSA